MSSVVLLGQACSIQMYNIVHENLSYSRMSSFCEDLENLLSHHPDSANQEVSQQDDQYSLESLSLTEVQSFNPFR